MSLKVWWWRFCHAQESRLYKNIWHKIIKGGFIPTYILYGRYKIKKEKLPDEWFDGDGNLKPNA